MFYAIVFIYFLTRIILLNHLPIFNDEAIYLDWGWKEIHIPGYLFYSLYDTKQPLVMWIFGIFETILPNPLIAGRLVSAITGFLTFFGLYKIGEKFWNKKIALLGALIYTFTPIFVFYDRQALMESSVAAVGIWSAYWLLQILSENQKKDLYSIILGVTLGLGFFIKTSSLVFLATAVILLAIKKRWRSIFFLTFPFLLVILPLITQSLFWQTLSMTDRYATPLPKLLKFPVFLWIGNLVGDLNIMFFFTTPFVLLLGICGIVISVLKNNTTLRKTISYWFLITMFFQILTILGPTQRPLISFIPLICIFAASFLFFVFNKFKKIGIILMIATLAVCLCLTSFEIINPTQYILQLDKFTGYSQTEYVLGYTSGYKLNDVLNFINKKADQNNGVNVLVALNTGNPENALFAYYEKSPNVRVSYFDGRTISQLDKIDCLQTQNPSYFISRGYYLTNLDKFLVNVKKIYLINSKTDFIGIWTFKNPCKGITVNLNFNQTQQ